MSETIILIMTSSSTRNTEPRGGRVAVIRSVPILAHLSTKVRKNRQRVQRLDDAPWNAVNSFVSFLGCRIKRMASLRAAGMAGSTTGTPDGKNAPQESATFCIKE